jgi:peptidoglycan/LPS O-acetylase OafA/YrhL
VITWSLCVEEQFYLIWPALVLLLSPRKMTWLLVAVIVAAPILRVVLPHYGWDPYINPLTRFDAMAMGSLLAMWIYFRMPDARRIARTAWLIILAAALGEVAFHAAHLTRITSKSMVAAAFTALIALALSVPRLSRILSFSPLVATGRISYCMYLCHVIVAKMVLAWLPQSPALLRVSIILALTYAVALCSWHLLEAPSLTMKRYFQADRPEGQPVGHSLPAIQFEESGGG